MKKMFLATCLLAASIFAAPQASEKVTPAAKPTAEVQKKEPATQEVQTAVEPKAEVATQEAPVSVEPKNDSTAQETQTVAESKAIPTTELTKDSSVTQPVNAVATEETPANETLSAIDSTTSDSSVTVQEVTTEVASAAPENQTTEANKQPKKKKRKKKKLIEKAVVETASLAFDVQADFELEAGKVFWTSEKDSKGENLETWNGEANFAVLAEGEDFKGKIGIAFYPGDLRMQDETLGKKEKKAVLREGTDNGINDYFSLDEAWAMQNTDYFVFKVGRWDNTDKNGDYFGGYVDGYMNGFMSTQPSENQLQFGFTPSDNLDFFISLISQSPNLNKGDLRAAFNFHGLESLSELNVQLAYRSNLFDKVYDAEVDVKHNASLKAKLPIVRNFINIFAEAALMNIDPNEDMIIPITGGFAFETKIVDRIILEAEWVKDRQKYEDFQGFQAKHVKEVLGALYLEKAFTDRFSLSAGLHSYGSTKDYMLSGNLVGRIN